MRKNRKPFCYAPWISLQYGSLIQSGGFTPCCEARWTGVKGSYESYLNSTRLNDFKIAHMRHDKDFINEVCETCINLEKTTGVSTRTRLIEQVEQETFPYDLLSIVDYRPTNICNLKCRMCFPSNSSMIAKEQGITIDNNHINDIYGVDFSSVKVINIVGGEPSIDEHTDQFLQWLIDNKNRHLRLSITTNATNANDRWINKLKQFGEVIVNISIDGTEKTYEYVRTNANWESVRKNVEIYRNNFEVNFQITGSMYNIPSIDEWLPWFLRNDFLFHLYPVEGHKHLSLAALPDNIREEKIEYLTRLNDSRVDSAIDQLTSTAFDKEIYNKFVEFTNKLDRMRNTDIRTVSSVYERIMND